ncbi:MAG TPA: 5-(carboxyamino)imidazole ribonucleotide mutase [Candidatus Hydrogenedentes bacterium]|mgnify:FL=1|nr:5-(carboxyamino)imidazole ribonucleotide mutase [Candidatus Hydrogenedentota bacterium]
MNTSSHLVCILMGSDSDWEVLKKTHQILAQFGVPHESRVLSAHRTPDAVAEYVRRKDAEGVKVFIAGAGMAAALPGAVAALTVKPVIGVPLASGALNGVDALYAIAQMPPGVPVAGVAIGSAGATNAALLAVEILALEDSGLAQKLQEFRASQAERILSIKLED